jgi:hypothetical protein
MRTKHRRQTVSAARRRNGRVASPARTVGSPLPSPAQAPWRCPQHTCRASMVLWAVVTCVRMASASCRAASAAADASCRAGSRERGSQQAAQSAAVASETAACVRSMPGVRHPDSRCSQAGCSYGTCDPPPRAVRGPSVCPAAAAAAPASPAAHSRCAGGRTAPALPGEPPVGCRARVECIRRGTAVTAAVSMPAPPAKPQATQ